MRLFRTTALVLTLLIIAAAIAVGQINAALNQDLSLTADGVVFEVKSGDNLRKILRQLEQRGWLVSPRLIEWWARYEQLDQGLHVGEYRLSEGMTAKNLIVMLNRGEVIRYSITLPEGITLANAIARLHAEPGLIQQIDGPDDAVLLGLVAPHPSAEGWFLPETYQFTRGDSDLDILTRAHEAMQTALAAFWQARDADVPLETEYEALILASIVERETSVPEERPAIAGVFTRRLISGMRLQTDPTVIYGVGEQYTGNLTRKHLRDDTNPWNTYVIRGLPPTPIALPGVAALEAAVHPAAGDSLYFVAKGDGYHAFAATLEEHNANVKRYQLSRRGDYRSTPERGR